MNEHFKSVIGRRALLRTLTVGAVAATSLSAPVLAAEIPVKNKTSKGRARYQPNSAEVQTFYRVNRYPNDRCGRGPC
jgi:hypothetical protein